MIIKIVVGGMLGEHCSEIIKIAIKKISAVEKVEVDLEGKIVIVRSSILISDTLLKEIIEEEGYEFLGIL